MVRKPGSPARLGQGGFTLIEMIMVLALSGILMAVVAMIMQFPITAYYDTLRRAQLVNGADTAMRRIAQEVRTALPNSLRQYDFGADSCIMLLPVVGGGLYRTEPATDGSGDVLSFNGQDSAFDVLTGANLPDFSTATYHAVIYNLGIAGADAYATPTDKNRVQINGASSTANRIVLASSNRFPFQSPGRRFMVMPNYSVIYSCVGDKLYRTTGSVSSGTLSACPGSGQLLAERVASCKFYYASGVTAAAGLLSVRLGVAEGGETVTMYQDIHVDNAP